MAAPLRTRMKVQIDGADGVKVTPGKGAGETGKGASMARPTLLRPVSTVDPDIPDDDVPPSVPPHLLAIWRLANGVANDFNNILQVIGGSAEGLLSGLDSSDPRRVAAQAIVDAAKRASGLTRQLQAVGRRQASMPTQLDLSELVAEALPELRRHIHPQVRVVTYLTAKLPCVHVDRCHMREMLTDLAGYACDAMAHGGTLTLITGLVNVGPQMMRVRPWLRPGRYVRLEVADSGRGVDPQSLPHLFEPFYNANARTGAGLQLSAVYSVVKQSGGFVWVESEVGQGSRVTVLLPASGAPASTEMFAAARGRVLLVEDDESVRELLDGVLMHHGYSVAAYGSAEDALGHQDAFDLLLTDVVLPGLSGPGLAREIKRRSPEVPVLLMSGDAGHAGDLDELSPRAFLQKPFSSQALIASVERLLSA
jgi:CheY-like chemotaxis protein